MNIKELPMIEIPIVREAHRFAGQFATEQATPEKSKQVYLNTLAVYAVHRYLQWLQIETDLNQGDSWHPVVRSRLDVADLVIPGRGKLESRPVLPGETAFAVPDEVAEDRIGYLAVQFSDRLDKVQLLGFSPTAVAGVVHLSELRSLEELIDEISKPIPVILSQSLSGVFDIVWQHVEEVLGRLQTNYEHTYQAANTRFQESNFQRAKQIDIGKNQVVILVTITPNREQKIGILVQVKPANKQPYLPANLTLAFLSNTGESIHKFKSNISSKSLQIPGFTANIGDKLIIEITCDNLTVQEAFIIENFIES
ncbi:DUF1822 family protein [Desmonostoc muscorum LEGE 12446]|uniref:DUF1822 family protein n=1 Tax=Desmonostoc muscorum LEGE 12446 TaxID=1828758 RepID=A0A8J7CXG6_DESMC|nr:DUF1822 family protein [Desmonostoc muscorum]MCF2148198.1 DUF1822 family protein [Desmonostoc muscorum LEGE 12446]